MVDVRTGCFGRVWELVSRGIGVQIALKLVMSRFMGIGVRS